MPSPTHCVFPFVTTTMATEPLKSVDYPNLVVLERELRGSPKLRSGMVPAYSTSTHRVICYEFRGYGTPPEDVGSAGDIFWDVTFPFILYIRGADLWEAWNPRASAGCQLLAPHPCFLDRYLWIGGSGPTWLAQQSLYKAQLDTKQFHGLDDASQADLAAILCSSPSFKLLALDIPENRARHDSEVKRRHQHGVAVGSWPDISTPSTSKRKRVPADSEETAAGRSILGWSFVSTPRHHTEKRTHC